jgi:hypothetical protein
MQAQLFISLRNMVLKGPETNAKNDEYLNELSKVSVVIFDILLQSVPLYH